MKPYLDVKYWAKENKFWVRKAWWNDEGEWMGWENEEEEERILLLVQLKIEGEKNEILEFDVLINESDPWSFIGGFLSLFKLGWIAHFKSLDGTT